MEFFERQWFTYRTIVNHNLMEHGPLAEATAAALEGWLAQRPPGAAPPRMLDLGCGDLALLAPLLQRLPLGSYTGLDLAAAVLAERGAIEATATAVGCQWQWIWQGSHNCEALAVLTPV